MELSNLMIKKFLIFSLKKFFLYFLKWKFPAPRIKKILILFPKNPALEIFLILFNPTSKCFPEKLSHIFSRKKRPEKNSLYFPNKLSSHLG